jgi:hypothetical protein
MNNENKKMHFFQKIEQSYILKIVICVALSSIVIALFFISNSAIDNKKSRKYSITSDMRLINQIEDIGIINNRINIKGYAFLLDMDSEDTNISIFLRSVDEDKEIWTDVEQSSRADVASLFNNEYNYINSGFNAMIKESKLNEGECYEIIVKLDYLSIDNDDNSKTVSTNRYVINGELYSYNPINFEHPNIESDLLREAFTKGQLCFYQKDEGLYVYQYNNKLYWITDDNFNFNKDGLTSISCNIYTSQADKLPEYRMQYLFDTREFYFEEHEYIDENIAPYRVAIWDIPNDYPISSITAGEYDSINSKWVWNTSFHINYIFD